MAEFRYLGGHLSFRDFRAWRRARMERQSVVTQLAVFSREHLFAGRPRYLAAFAHDGNSHVISVFGRPEDWQMDIVFEFLSSRGLIFGSALDIGANIGIHSLLFAQKYDRVVAFEPHPQTFQLLRFNLENYAPNAIALNIALYSDSRTLILADANPGNIGAASLHGSQDSADGFEVMTCALDEVAQVADLPISLVKIDTEGAEHDVLLGAESLIEKNKPVVIMEDFKSRSGQRSEAVRFLEGLGYDTFLEPAFFPTRRTRKGLVSRLHGALDIWRRGHAFGLRDCDYLSPRGYDLLLALHKTHAAAAGVSRT